MPPVKSSSSLLGMNAKNFELSSTDRNLVSLDDVKGDAGTKGLQGAAGTGLTNCGNWASGTTYAPGCYVFYATSGTNSTIAMWILEGTESYTSTIFPYVVFDLL